MTQKLPPSMQKGQPLQSNLFHVKQEEDAGVRGGDVSANVWETRPLNTVVDSKDWANHSTILQGIDNVFGLKGGIYWVKALGPTHRTERNRLRLYNNTLNAPAVLGHSMFARDGSQGSLNASLIGKFEVPTDISSFHDFTLQQRFQTARSMYGFGVDSNFNTMEKYTDLKIWRVGDYEPMTYTLPTTDLNLWLDASDSSTITHTSNSISQWDDKSSNNNHAVQATASNQPQYDTSELGIIFDGSDDFMNFTNPIDNTDETVFVVLEALSNQAGFRSYLDTRTDVHILQQDGGNNWGFYRGQFINSGTSLIDRNAIIVTEKTNRGSNGKLITNGRQNNTWSGLGQQDTSPETSSLGRNTGYNQNSHMRIRELIIYSKAMTDTERQEVEGYLAHKWGHNQMLPFTHPYKYTRPT